MRWLYRLLLSKTTPPNQWQPHYAIRDIATLDKETIKGPVMRRVQYRKMTPEEMEDYIKSDAW